MRLFFTLLPQRTNWHQKAADPAEFIIDETFGVPGVGTVVAGADSALLHGHICTTTLGLMWVAGTVQKAYPGALGSSGVAEPDLCMSSSQGRSSMGLSSLAAH